MEFRLVYEGPLPANGGPRDKQRIRRAFHPQLAGLWRQRPLRLLLDPGEGDGNYSLAAAPTHGEVSLVIPVSGFQFVPTVHRKLNLVCGLDILFLRREEPGAIITQGGDIDNRLKTLLDALRMPQEPGEIPAGDSPQAGETPFFCLLEDDFLVTRVGVTTDRLLTVGGPTDVSLVIHATARPTMLSYDNINLGG